LNEKKLTTPSRIARFRWEEDCSEGWLIDFPSLIFLV
jgi:hypothetical protein